MKKAMLIATAISLLAMPVATAVELGSISIGFHLNPALDTEEGRRSWDLSISAGIRVSVGGANSVELSAVVDSILSSLGATFTYHRAVSDPFTIGAGLNMLWRFETEETLVRTVVGSFAHACARPVVLPNLVGEMGLSFPLVSFTRQHEGWQILPLSELPAVHLAADWQGWTGTSIQARVTMQPVILDTTRFQNPIGRISDTLLVLPTYSTFVRFVP